MTYELDEVVVEFMDSTRKVVAEIPFSAAIAFGLSCMECLWSGCSLGIESEWEEVEGWRALRHGLDRVWDCCTSESSEELDLLAESCMNFALGSHFDSVESGKDNLLMRSAGAFAGIVDAFVRRDQGAIYPSASANIDMIDCLVDDVDLGFQDARLLFEAEFSREREWLQRVQADLSPGGLALLREEASKARIFGDFWFAE